MADRISEFLPKPAELEITASDYVKESRLPDFDEVITVHSPAIMENLKETLKDVYERIIKKPAQGVYNFLLMPSELTPDQAQKLSIALVPAAAAATLASGMVDTSVEAVSGSQAVGTGIGKIEAIRHMEDKLWGRLGLTAATALAVQSPIRIGMMKNLDYYYNKAYKSQKLEL
ncbi:unnamed protein product [marine sediment metagenome]|uniref:Uncharacterized protein n=1 Tax=marine sediment metagenome TaxID=412755 RepID=X1QGT9_9ZZZZ